MYLNTYFKLTYSSIDDITNTLKKLGPWAMLFKVNISRASRHIRIAPLAYWEYIIMTPMLPFDFRHGSTFFHNCCDTICHIMRQHGFPYFWNYIDKLIYTDLPSQIYNAYQFLINLLSELGLDVSKEKLVAPAAAVTCLGILIDTRTRTISIPHSKLQKIHKLCKDWTHKTSCTESQLQSLFRSLLYISKCVQPARCFLNRMLALLRANHESNIIQLTEDFAKDCSWYFWTLKIVFHIMILRVLMRPYTWMPYIHILGSLTGLCCCFNQMVCTIPFPLGYNILNINHLEMVNVMIALKIWGPLWIYTNISIRCDKLPVMEVLTTDRARDEILASYRFWPHAAGMSGCSLPFITYIYQYSILMEDRIIWQIYFPSGFLLLKVKKSWQLSCLSKLFNNFI